VRERTATNDREQLYKGLRRFYAESRASRGLTRTSSAFGRRQEFSAVTGSRGWAPLVRGSRRATLPFADEHFVTFQLMKEPFTLYLGCLSVAVFEHSFSVERTRHKTPEVRCEKFTLAIAVASLFALLVSAFHRMSRLGREAFKSTPPMATTIAITIATGVMANARNLRAACLHKEDLGEQGQGNCQRYRQMCGRG
jgi:hypothetical protein